MYIFYEQFYTTLGDLCNFHLNNPYDDGLRKRNDVTPIYRIEVTHRTILKQNESPKCK